MKWCLLFFISQTSEVLKTSEVFKHCLLCMMLFFPYLLNNRHLIYSPNSKIDACFHISQKVALFIINRTEISKFNWRDARHGEERNHLLYE
jgi:hypothetical protein